MPVAPKALTFLLDENNQEPKPKMFRSMNKTAGKRMSKTELMRVQKKISSFAKQAVLDLKNESGGETVEKDAEHKVVFDWCVQSASEMLQAMSMRHQKIFAKQVSDQVEAGVRLEREA